ncbi:MAG: GNAT family N-acetyltransferase [Lachnospiraceae bacterium]|nr:GNAT family N-acetyltransferase [Lachnospiraceae bacterium]
MLEKFLLDKGTVFGFQELYPTDVSVCADATHVSFGGIYDGKPAALISLRVESSELYMDWIYTAEEYRNRGIMTELWEYVFERITFAGSYDTLNVVCSGDELRDFLEKQSFMFEYDEVATLYASDIGNMKELKGKAGAHAGVKLKDLGNTELKLLNNELINAKEAAYCIKLPVIASDYHELSRVSISKNILNAIVLLTRESMDTMDIAYVYKTNGSEVALMLMIKEIRDEVIKVLPECKRIRTTALNDGSRVLFEALFNDHQKEPVYSGMKLLV